MRKILIVEDTPSLQDIIKSVVKEVGYNSDCVDNVATALKLLKDNSYACILSDYKLVNDLTGVDLLRKIRSDNNTTPFVLLTAFASLDIAIQAMKSGANDFLTKPFDRSHLLSVIKQIIEHKQILNRNSNAPKNNSKIITHSKNVTDLLEMAIKAARVEVPVFISGESGTGKELLARLIHENSPRKNKPFVAVNCAAIPSELLESEFFGHEAGSFTGATQKRVGVFEYASEGTLFLDEIGDMPKHLQVKLLRALQEKEIRRVGSEKNIPVNPRIISATHKFNGRNIEKFDDIREDLYYRLSVVQLLLPPLRERKEDIMPLVEYYLEIFSERFSISKPKLTESAINDIMSYSWPGNIRELENVIERAVIFSDGTIESKDIQIPRINIVDKNLNNNSTEIIESNLELGVGSLVEASGKASKEAEIKVIKKALAESKGNKTVAAKLIDVSYKTLLAKIKEYEL